jgi:homoisocitrate dehydrogenase
MEVVAFFNLDIISDGAAALVGSLGLVPSANVGDAFVMGEPIHGSAPDIAGKNLANPIAAIRSCAMLLTYLNELEDAKRIDDVVDQLLRDQIFLTPDLGGNSLTSHVVTAIVKALEIK